MSGLHSESDGASTEFQEIVSELKDLADILRVIETLDPSHTNPTQSDTIRSHGAVTFTHPEQLSPTRYKIITIHCDITPLKDIIEAPCPKVK
jgi:hypothetical protein